MTIFDWVKQIKIHKKSWESFTEDEQNKFSSFFINRFLSMDKDFIEVVNVFQKYSIGILESKEVYKFYSDILPTNKKFTKYIKSKKLEKYNEELINILKNHFECSKLQTKQYLELISREELKEILEMYGTESKKVKKLLKL